MASRNGAARRQQDPAAAPWGSSSQPAAALPAVLTPGCARPPPRLPAPQGWRCDMWEVLAPVRAVRPLNGGPGFDRDLVLDLRTLNFEIG